MSRLPVYPFLVWEYFTVHSIGALFHIMLPRANTGCILYREIHLIKRAVLKELISNKPIKKIYTVTYRKNWEGGPLREEDKNE